MGMCRLVMWSCLEIGFVLCVACVCLTAALLLRAGTYLSIKQAPAQLQPGRLSARQLGLSYRDITWKLCLGQSVPGARSAYLLDDLPLQSIVLPLLPCFPLCSISLQPSASTKM